MRSLDANEVLVVLEIHDGARDVAGEAAGSDPHVADRREPDAARGQPGVIVADPFANILVLVDLSKGK
jgi:hypothetical protein